MFVQFVLRYRTGSAQAAARYRGAHNSAGGIPLQPETGRGSGGGRSHISESNHGANPATRVAPLKIRGESYVQQSQDYRDHGAIVAAPVCNHLNCGTCGALIRGGGSGATFWAFALPLGSVI